MLSNKKSIMLFSIPSFLFYTVFIIVSTFSTIKYSFTDFSGIGKANFVGMENYKRLLTDEIFIKSCSNTIIILMVSFYLFCRFLFSWLMYWIGILKGVQRSKLLILPHILLLRLSWQPFGYSFWILQWEL